ncbi:MAG: ABC transporter permease [Planctomycetota bacterium]|nr:ABC transporter permease [Planctomycetota bacterium]
MRNAYLVATREYAENARTKGFWVNLLMFPILLVASVKVPELLQDKAKPVRHFVLLDQSGEFEGAVQKGIDRAHNRKVAGALLKHAQVWSDPKKAPEAPDVDWTQLPADQMGNFDPSQDPLEQFEAMVGQGEIAEAFSDPAAIKAFESVLRASMKPDAPEFSAPRRDYERVELPEGVDPTAPVMEIAKGLKPYLSGGKMPGSDRGLFALVVIPPDAAQRLKRPTDGAMAAKNQQHGADGVQFWSSNLTDQEFREEVQSALDAEVRAREFERRGVDEKTVKEVQQTRIQFASFDPTKAEGDERVSIADTLRKWAPVGFVYLLFVAIFNTVVMLLNNTVEEKSNRIIEVLVSSATPGEIMMGKLMGIAGVGLTMLCAWVLSLLGVLMWFAGPSVQWAGPLLDVIRSSGLLPLFAFYFVGGYLIFAGIFLAVGSLCSTVKEAQNFVGSAIILLMVPLFTMVFVAQEPNGTLATVMSWIPIYTPFVMMNRAAADPPLFELWGTGILMAVTAIGMLWLSGKIFRIGILRTGQPPRLIELLKALRTPSKLQ